MTTGTNTQTLPKFTWLSTAVFNSCEGADQLVVFGRSHSTCYPSFSTTTKISIGKKTDFCRRENGEGSHDPNHARLDQILQKKERGALIEALFLPACIHGRSHQMCRTMQDYGRIRPWCGNDLDVCAHVILEASWIDRAGSVSFPRAWILFI